MMPQAQVAETPSTKAVDKTGKENEMAKVMGVSQDTRVGDYAVSCPTCCGTGKVKAPPLWNPGTESVEYDDRDCVVCYGCKYVTPRCRRCGRVIASVNSRPFCPDCNECP